MSRLRILLAAVLAASVLAVLAGPAHASVPTANSKFCKAAAKISASTNEGNTPTPKEASALASKFKAAANQAPAKVKSAGNTIVSVLKKIGHSGANAADLANFYRSSDFKKYGKAIGTFFAYVATCPSS
jgi:hypothetical protein